MTRRRLHEAFITCHYLSIDFEYYKMTSCESTTDRQWLLTNGLGGFAFGTEAGIHTRRYHGLLVAAISPPVRRTVCLHSIVEQLDIDGEHVPLSTYLFGDDMQRHPDGWRHLVKFTRASEREIVWTYELGTLRIEKRIRLHQLCNAVSVVYHLQGTLPRLLRLRPMTPMRGFHSMSHEAYGSPQPQPVASTAMLVNSGDVRVRLIGRSSDCEVSNRIEPQWWNDVRYPEDRARGQDWSEDLWSPGVFEFDLSGICSSTDTVECRLDVEVAAPTLPLVHDHCQDTRSEADNRLHAAAEQFIVKRLTPDGAGYFDSIIAGYPWFADWGRDAMISLPGLLLCTGQIERAVSVLRAFGRSMRNGLVPNCFNDEGGAQYNSVDAGLWFVHAVAQVQARTSPANQRELIDYCRQIIAAYRSGTEFDIRMDDDGLITAGNEHTQITWMDAARDGVVFTPRHGKAVEINALWYNALRSLAAMTDRDSERDELTDLAAQTAQSFTQQFWWNERNCLHDVLSPADDGQYQPDEKLRPNQIFAVSLPYSPLPVSQQRAVVQVIEDRLLTPYGLRTLDRDDPDYCGRFEGDLYARDGAYHQGTVWPWLIGPYGEAMLRVNDFDAPSKEKVRQCIAPLLAELDSACIGQIAEVYDGDPPHRADGCVAQAWSVAELLRVQSLLSNQTHCDGRANDNRDFAGAESVS